MHLGDDTSRANLASHTREVIRQQRSQVDVLHAVVDEMAGQRALKAAGKFELTPADLGMSNVRCAVVLMEEVGAVARAICEDDHAGLYTELVQVAAVATAWASRLRRQWTDSDHKPTITADQLHLFPADPLTRNWEMPTLGGKESE